MIRRRIKMSERTATTETAPVAAEESIKLVPPEPEVRAAIRETTLAGAAGLDPATAPSRAELARQGEAALARLGLPRAYLGFAMVAVDNAFWREQFSAVPLGRRLLLLPHCLRDEQNCAGTYDADGLHCADCGGCLLAPLRQEALALGYEVVVAEGTSLVTARVLEGGIEALLGVACLDSLEKSFARIADLGLPHLALPLLRNGCVRTEVEVDLLRSIMQARGGTAATVTHSPLPLLRASVRTFETPALAALLAPYLAPDSADTAPQLGAAESLAWEWLRKGGKRLRPFLTLAAYAVARHGWRALTPGEDVAGLLPDSVRRLGVAIEALHKASLVHDDIEDDDARRYGEPTLHRTHGVPTALNVGDYLVGLGYRVIAGEADALGAECVVDILSHLAAAHLELCRGQGAELRWTAQGAQVRPVDALALGARKTAPAFEVALYAGLRAAGAEVNLDWLRRFAVYVGEGYQVLNDLEDWRDEPDHGRHGQDALAARPTILRAFAGQAGGGERLAELEKQAGEPQLRAGAVRALYDELGAFDQAERLLDRLRERALALAAEAGDPPLVELMSFLVRNLLRARD
jgi:geranylgeranyl pyrophosphate synthase